VAEVRALRLGRPLVPTSESLTDPVTAPDPVHHDLEHLLCYQARVARKAIAQSGCGVADPADKGVSIVPKQAKHAKLEGLYVANQFGAERLDTVTEAELCIPSSVD